MAPLQALLVVALIQGVGAQLVYKQYVDFQEVLNEVEEAKTPRQQAKEAQPYTRKSSGRLSSPTICDPGVKQYSGYLPAGEDSEYFFWFFESRRNPSKDPLILWLNGGPACSSMLGMMTENGPCTVNKNGSTDINPFSWNARANTIFLDQPGGTGFSYGTLPVNSSIEDMVAANMFSFFESFYKALPQYASLDLYIFGESYAGHYIPNIANYFVKQAQLGNFNIPLKGVGIGNGLTVPEVQYAWYPTMAHDGGKREGGSLAKGVINDFTYWAMQASVGPCVDMIRTCNANPDDDVCLRARYVCNTAMLNPYQYTGMNVYDMRKPCGESSLCYDFSAVDNFFNADDIQAQIGVNKTWLKCNYDVYAWFSYDWMRNYDTKLPDVLAANIKVLIYAGDVDYICNWLGNKKWTLAMEWPYQEEFKSAEDLPYNVSGIAAGRIRSYQNFHFMQVYQAGHMAPTDQPEVLFQMLEDFITGKLDPPPSNESDSVVHLDGESDLRNIVSLPLAAGILLGFILVGFVALLVMPSGRQHDLSSYKLLLH